MTRTLTHPVVREPESAWEVATLFPPQGQWNESDYLDATQKLDGDAYVTHSEVGESPSNSAHASAGS